MNTYGRLIEPVSWWDERAMQRDKKGRFVTAASSRSDGFGTPNTAFPPKPPLKRPRFMSTVQQPYVARMQYSVYPSCCGAGIWTGFSYLPMTKNIEYFERAFKIEFEKLKSTMFSLHNGLVSAIITQSQLIERPALHDAMVKAGFQVVHKTGNPNHNHETTLFHYSYVTPHRTAEVTTNEEVADMLNKMRPKTEKIL